MNNDMNIFHNNRVINKKVVAILAFLFVKLFCHFLYL